MEEEEGGTSIVLIFLVAVAEASIHVVVFSNEDLDFVELLQNVLDEAGGSLLESSNSVGLSVLLQLGLDGFEVS